MKVDLLWIRGSAAAWPGLEEGFGAGLVVDAETDPTSMRDVRAAVVAHRPRAVLYRPPLDGRAEANPEWAFSLAAEAPIGVVAAGLELDAKPILLSDPMVFGGAGGPWLADDVPEPGGVLAESLRRGEVFFSRAAQGRGLLVRAGPILSTGLEEEERRLALGWTPTEGRKVTPVSDHALGQALRAWLESDATGVVHLAGPEIREPELWARLAAAIGVEAPASRRAFPGTGRIGSLEGRPAEWESVLKSRPAAASPSTPVAFGERLLDPLAEGPEEVAPPPAEDLRLWADAEATGCFELGPGVMLWRLRSGDEARWGAGAIVTLLEGKALLELPGEDRVATVGQRSGPLSAGRCVAVAPSRLVVVEAGRR